MSLVIIRLLPVERISGDDFTTYLDGLSIAVHEATFDDPGASEDAVETARYFALTLHVSTSEDDVVEPDPESRITQHYSASAIPDTDPVEYEAVFYAVATAVIEVADPPDYVEHETADCIWPCLRPGNN